ncbi:MAG TPA: signal peptidase I, partial [Actinobacteria bacterium]|nr:signal peptidase I [Actinomycetota bacterium]
IGTPGGGFVPQDRLVGRAFVVTFPFDSLRRLPIPETFKQPAIETQKGKSS